MYMFIAKMEDLQRMIALSADFGSVLVASVNSIKFPLTEL